MAAEPKHLDRVLGDSRMCAVSWLSWVHVRGPGESLTDALAAHVLPEAHVALAAVAGGRGDAAAVQAQVGEVLAHVDGVVEGHCA